MYKARAEAVSGTRVYADGKWLRCIGNKCVSVGEYVWTDGRCVYGHEQESQQPKVITAPQDEGIPILLTTTLSTDEGYSVNKKLYYTYDSKLRPLEPPKSLGFTGSEMINAYKRDAYLISYDGASTFYAGNIDKSGNVYKLIGTSRKITIYKNGEEFSTTDLAELIGTQLRQEAIYSIPSGGRPNSEIWSGYAIKGHFAVIENENDWNALLFIYAYGRQAIIGEEVDISYERFSIDSDGIKHSTTIPRTDHASGTKEFQSITVCLVNQDGYTILDSCIGTSFDLWGKTVDVYDLAASVSGWGNPVYSRTVVIEDEHHYSASISSPNKDVKFHLQDGFYFTIDDYPNFPDNMFCYPIFIKISIYTRANKLLFTETFRTRSRITIGKVKSRYLIAVRNTTRFGVEILDANTGYSLSSNETGKDEGDISDNDRYKNYATGTSYIDAGLYLFDEKTLKKIADETCLNARFRAMTKYKNWQKRIQKL